MLVRRNRPLSSRLRLLAAAALVAAPVAVLPAAQAATVPPASVVVLEQGREQQFDDYSGAVLARCAPGHAFQGLAMEGRQGEYEAHWNVPGPLTCDGQWHRLRYRSAPGFTAGAAVEVSARLTVVDVEHQDPAPQGVDTGSVWVRPATAIRLDRRPTLRRNGVVVVHLLARCDRPWVDSSLGVTVTQRGGTVAGSAYLPTGALVCDDAFHRVHLRTEPDRGFGVGRVVVLASLDVKDPESFDPVAGTSVQRTLRLVR